MKLRSLERMYDALAAFPAMDRSALADMMNAVECEIDERYAELAVDADGVPIKRGDTLYRLIDGRRIDGKYVYASGNGLVYFFNPGWPNERRGITGYVGSDYSHRQPDTWERLFADVWNGAIGYDDGTDERDFDDWRAIFEKRFHELKGGAE